MNKETIHMHNYIKGWMSHQCWELYKIRVARDDDGALKANEHIATKQKENLHINTEWVQKNSSYK